jgi:hypothetical protein
LGWIPALTQFLAEINIWSEAEQPGGRTIISSGARLGASGVWLTGSQHTKLPWAGA